jgi:hypothetical protein
MAVNDELITWNEAFEMNFKVLFQHLSHAPPPFPAKLIKYSKQPVGFLIEFVIMLTVKQERLLYTHHKGV